MDSLNFPSFLPGFAGQRLQLSTSDPELRWPRPARGTTGTSRSGPVRTRTGSFPCHLPCFLDPEIGAQEIYRNAERGFKTVTFSEAPHALGLPSLHTGYRDPVMRACAETATVVNLHIGSSGTSPSTSDDAPPDVAGVLFFGYAMFVAVDWLFSRIPVRFPDIKVVMSEGGIGWVPALLDRIRHMATCSSMYGTWNGIAESPAEVLRRNFYFCAVEDPSAFALRDQIGIEHILMEEDYPHSDSLWPRTLAVVQDSLQELSADKIRKVAWENASRLYRHPVPQSVVDDPGSF